MSYLFKDLGDALRPEKMKMDKIKEAFEKAFPYDKMFTESERDYRFFTAGFKAANLLPTEIDCPECDENGYYIPQDGIGLKGIYKCPVRGCKNGKIQIYYTPEEYKEITGEDYPDDALVWMKPYIAGLEFIFERYVHKKNVKGYITYIVQTAQKCPRGNYGE